MAETEKKDFGSLRYYLDFKLIPSLFIKEPGGVLNMLENGGMYDCLCKIFNDILKDVKTFTKDDFKIQKYEDQFSFVYLVTLPDAHANSLVWCEQYGFAFIRNNVGYSCQFFTVENSHQNLRMLCGVDRKTNHLNFGRAKPTDKENAEKMLEIIQPPPIHVEL